MRLPSADASAWPAPASLGDPIGSGAPWLLCLTTRGLVVMCSDWTTTGWGRSEMRRIGMTIEEKRVLHREYMRVWRANNPERVREISRRYKISHPDIIRKALYKWRSKHREIAVEINRRWRERHPKENRESQIASIEKWNAKYPEKVLANKIAQRLIPIGSVCERCGGIAKHRHHPNYSKPLEVIHLCHNCHMLLHRSMEVGK